MDVKTHFSASAGAESAQLVLCHDKNGKVVTYDPVHSHATTHLEDTPELTALLTELIADMELVGDVVAGSKDMGRIVGTCDVVATDTSDDLVYAMRKNRQDQGLVPFTKSRPAEPCSSVAYHLVVRSNESYELLSAWIGTYDDDEPFPLAVDANDKSATYWSTHAFVWGSQEIIPGTETSRCPW